MSFPAAPWLHRALPRFGRRLVVIDPGSRFVRTLVVDASFGVPRIAHFQTFDFAPGTTEGAELIEEQLETLFAAAGPHERVLVLPQYRAISQVVDVPPGSADEVQAGLAREARRLSGLDEGALAFDAVKLKPYGRLTDPHWLTLCKREELDALLARFAGLPEAPGAPVPRLAQVTTSGQALFAGASVVLPDRGNGVLVDLRVNNSVLAIVVAGQGVSTTTLPIGTRQLSEAMGLPAGGNWVTEPEATLRERTAAGTPGGAAFEKWVGEIRLALLEWLEDNPDCGLVPADFRAFLCGLGATRPDFIELVNRSGPLRFESWEEPATRTHRWPMADYLVPYGAALMALGRAPQGVSLLPAEARLERRRRQTLATLHTANVLLLGLVFVVLGLGLWQKWSLIERKQGLTQRSQGALQTALQIDQLYRELNLDYERVYPVLLRQRQTLDTLQALAATQTARTNDDFWYVLFADAVSYQAGTSGLALASLPAARPAGATNAPASAPPERREFIVELCVPREGEALRRVLSDVVANLKRNVLFNRVDSLPPERKRDLVDPKVAVSNRVFAVAMEVAGRRLTPPAPLPERPRPAAAPGTRRPGAKPETPEGPTP